MAWRVFAAAATGKSHLDGGIPCQDAFFSATVGDTLVAAVCDGAGSQPLSHLGAAALSQGVVQALAQRLEAGGAFPLGDATALHAIVADAVATVRNALERVAVYDGSELQQFAATLVGVVADGQGGAFFHVGDGQGVAELSDDTVTLSLPENGEYANETYFVTGEAWREHLRVTPFAPGASRLALMSDGAASFVLDKGQRALFRAFVDPVCAWLASSPDDATAQAGLHGTLDDPRTHRITGDDKTLLLALWT
jgi:hypothetical protein